MFGKKPYKPPPPGWTKRALSHWDCCEFGLYGVPTIGWLVHGDVDIEWLSTTLRATIKRRAPWIGGRFALTESGAPRFEIHVPPPDSDVECLLVTQVTVEEPIKNSVPYVEKGCFDPLVAVQPGFDPVVINPQAKLTDSVWGYIKRDEPLLRLHFTIGPDATIITFCFLHPVFDLAGFMLLMDAWKEELEGIEPKTVVDTSIERPDTYFDFTEEVELDPKWAPNGWLKATPKMWAIVIGRLLSDIYYYGHKVYGLIVIPQWLTEKWKAEANRELVEGQFVSTADLIFAWYVKHGSAPYPATDGMSIMSTICLRLHLPDFPKHYLTNSATSYVLPDRLTVGEIQRMSITELALKFRAATDIYNDPANVLREMTFEYRRNREANGGRSYAPFNNPYDRFFLMDSLAKAGVDKMNFSKKGCKPVTLNTCLTYFGEGMQLMVNDGQGGFRITGGLPKMSWNSLKKQLQKEIDETRQARARL